jgi:O-antigen ligase
MGAGGAADLIRQHPVTGTGIGNGWVFWQTPDGNAQVAQYVHNEYLQTVVDLGAVGAALLLCLIVAVGLTVRRAWRAGHRSAPAAGAVAALVAFAVHSGFDFLWHLAVLPLVAGVCIGLATGPAGGAATADSRRNYRREER